MRFKLRYILIPLFLAGIFVMIRKPLHTNLNATKNANPGTAYQSAGFIAPVPAYNGDFKIVEAPLTLKKGDTGIIRLLGANGEKFTIRSSFVRGSKAYNVVQTKTADKNGRVTFKWTVDKDTESGIYPVIINNSAKIVHLFHTVQ